MALHICLNLLILQINCITFCLLKEQNSIVYPFRDISLSRKEPGQDAGLFPILGLFRVIRDILSPGDRTKWYGQNVTDKMVAISIDFNSIELNIYLVTTNHKLQISHRPKLV